MPRGQPSSSEGASGVPQEVRRSQRPTRRSLHRNAWIGGIGGTGLVGLISWIGLLLGWQDVSRLPNGEDSLILLPLITVIVVGALVGLRSWLSTRERLAHESYKYRLMRDEQILKHAGKSTAGMHDTLAIAELLIQSWSVPTNIDHIAATESTSHNEDRTPVSLDPRTPDMMDEPLEPLGDARSGH